MGTPLGPKYIPYTYMDPLGMFNILLRSVRGTLYYDYARNLGL